MLLKEIANDMVDNQAAGESAQDLHNCPPPELEFVATEETIREKFTPQVFIDVCSDYRPAQGPQHIPLNETTNDGGSVKIGICADCEGVGKVYATLGLNDKLGDSGTCRLMESSCQKCDGTGVMGDTSRTSCRPHEPHEARVIGQRATACERLDKNDPAVNVDDLLANAGPSPFARRPRK